MNIIVAVIISFGIAQYIEPAFSLVSKFACALLKNGFFEHFTFHIVFNKFIIGSFYGINEFVFS